MASVEETISSDTLQLNSDYESSLGPSIVTKSGVTLVRNNLWRKVDKDSVTLTAMKKQVFSEALDK